MRSLLWRSSFSPPLERPTSPQGVSTRIKMLPPGSPSLSRASSSSADLARSYTSANPLRSNMLGELGGARLAMGHYGYDDGKPMELRGRIINPQLLRSSSSIRHLLRPDAHPEPAHSRFANSHVSALSPQPFHWCGRRPVVSSRMHVSHPCVAVVIIYPPPLLMLPVLSPRSSRGRRSLAAIPGGSPPPMPPFWPTPLVPSAS
jgi:hypothetical protein